MRCREIPRYLVIFHNATGFRFRIRRLSAFVFAFGDFVFAFGNFVFAFGTFVFAFHFYVFAFPNLAFALSNPDFTSPFSIR
jgi:hypothetical protein